jgi:tetratricopeptide (TPR) repeat protein
MRRTRVLLAFLAAVAAAAALLLGGSGSPAFNPLRASAAPTSADQNSLGRLLEGFSIGDTAGYVRKLEHRVALQPTDADALTLLGLAYQQRARETGDPTFYRLSNKALQRADAAGGRRPLIVQALASLANTRHRFKDGLALARRAVQLDPENGSAYGALGDALLNLGRYEEAFNAYDRMAVLAPGIASYTRVANARELLGRPAAAIEADALAPEADRSPVPEHVAWTLVQLGNVHFNTGQLEKAAKTYRDALRQLPGYVHAEAGLARVEASQGRYGRAIARLRHVVEVLPIPAYAIMLGDVLHASGQEAAARREYALVGAIERLFEANGVRTELQTALFDLDHDRSVADALQRARTAYASAPSIYAEDALAWGLLKAGRCEEARAHSVHALRLGTRDALLYFHRAMIERCLRAPSARSWFRRALAVNPHFSFRWAPVARRALTAAS